MKEGDTPCWSTLFYRKGDAKKQWPGASVAFRKDFPAVAQGRVLDDRGRHSY